jgi:hypothetical protein
MFVADRSMSENFWDIDITPDSEYRSVVAQCDMSYYVLLCRLRHCEKRKDGGPG